jgi:hypothetical protein
MEFDTHLEITKHTIEFDSTLHSTHVEIRKHTIEFDTHHTLHTSKYKSTLLNLIHTTLYTLRNTKAHY